VFRVGCGHCGSGYDALENEVSECRCPTCQRWQRAMSCLTRTTGQLGPVFGSQSGASVSLPLEQPGRIRRDVGELWQFKWREHDSGLAATRRKLGASPLTSGKLPEIKSRADGHGRGIEIDRSAPGAAVVGNLNSSIAKHPISKNGEPATCYRRRSTPGMRPLLARVTDRPLLKITHHNCGNEAQQHITIRTMNSVSSSGVLPFTTASQLAEVLVFALKY
jgi:hypothetical protein